MGLEMLGELVFNTHYQKLVLPVLLETALTIAILAFRIFYDTDISCSDFHSTDTTNQVLGLGTIGPDVLNGAGTHITRNQREVLCTIESHADTLSYDIVEHLAATT